MYYEAHLLDANGFPLLSCSPEWRSSKGSPPAVVVWSHFCNGEGNRWPPSDPPGRRASAEGDRLWTACWPLGKISSCAVQARRREPNDGAQMTEAIGLWLADIAAGFCKLSYSWVRVGKGAERLKWEWMYWSRSRYENDTRKLIFAGGGRETLCWWRHSVCDVDKLLNRSGWENDATVVQFAKLGDVYIYIYGIFAIMESWTESQNWLVKLESIHRVDLKCVFLEERGTF